jgi:4-hydroxy-4-methyl-2-oxoglutarate aldolase
MVDAQNGQGAVDYRIKPLWPEVSFAAPAVTVDCGPRDNLSLFIAIEVAQPGDVIMLATGAYEGTSVLGDHVAAMAKNKGVVAIVTDGLVRDVEGLIQVGLPVYCRGVSPNSPYKSGPCEVGTSITLGGVTVASGDLVVGDRGGAAGGPRQGAGDGRRDRGRPHHARLGPRAAPVLAHAAARLSEFGSHRAGPVLRSRHG